MVTRAKTQDQEENHEKNNQNKRRIHFSSRKTGCRGREPRVVIELSTARIMPRAAASIDQLAIFLRDRSCMERKCGSWLTIVFNASASSSTENVLSATPLSLPTRSTAAPQ